jgi:quercetin dioxygenase-like cupin family protein
MSTHVPVQPLTFDATMALAQRAMEAMPQVFIPVQTFSGHGMVTRVMFAPAGTAIIGKRHVQGQHNFLMAGTLELATEDGPIRLVAPEVIVSPPGSKRAAIAITDVVWATTIATDLSPEEVEQTLVVTSDDVPQLEQEPQP